MVVLTRPDPAGLRGAERMYHRIFLLLSLLVLAFALGARLDGIRE